MKKIISPTRIIKIIFISLTAIGFSLSCTDNPVVPSGSAVIEGKVVESVNQRPLSDVLVRSNLFAENASTDEEGKYSIEISLSDSVTRILSLIFSKEGYADQIISALAVKQGQLTVAPNAIMTKSSGPVGNSGSAANIVLVTIETSNIFVKGSGADETSDITFEVRDKQGIPMDQQHQENVLFRIEGGPNGGEFLSPDTVQTDNLGRVVTTLNSGTKAGALQIIAEIEGKAIFSAPVPISIHGGLPDLAHFSLGVENLNFAGYNLLGLENKVTVIVGDKFSNPVPPGTSVQFQSTGGIIAGSGLTDELGRATVILTSADPRPQGVQFSTLRRINPQSLPAYFAQPGYALVTAQTVSESQQNIYAEGIVLFSGISQISSVTPTTFSLQAGASQSFSYIVRDQNQNPLSPGTLISVSTSTGELSGDVSFTLPDTQLRGNGATNFTFVLRNANPQDLNGATDVTVTIKVSSVNGNVSQNIFGKMFP